MPWMRRVRVCIRFWFWFWLEEEGVEEGEEGVEEGGVDLPLMRTAVESRTVAMGVRPAARMVSPLSTRSIIPSATPRAHEASTLPLMWIMFVFRGRGASCTFFSVFGVGVSAEVALVSSLFVSSLIWAEDDSCSSSTSASKARKYRSVSAVKLVTTFLPIRDLGSVMLEISGTWIWRLHLPKPRSRSSSTPLPLTPFLPPDSPSSFPSLLLLCTGYVGARFASCSST